MSVWMPFSSLYSSRPKPVLRKMQDAATKPTAPRKGATLISQGNYSECFWHSFKTKIHLSCIGVRKLAKYSWVWDSFVPVMPGEYGMFPPYQLLAVWSLSVQIWGQRDMFHIKVLCLMLTLKSICEKLVVAGEWLYRCSGDTGIPCCN